MPLFKDYQAKENVKRTTTRWCLLETIHKLIDTLTQGLTSDNLMTHTKHRHTLLLVKLIRISPPKYSTPHSYTYS